MGSPDTYDVCKNCGEPVKWVNNTGNWIHVVSHLKGTGIADTDCVAPRLVVEQASKSQPITYRQAAKKS